MSRAIRNFTALENYTLTWAAANNSQSVTSTSAAYVPQGNLVTLIGGTSFYGSSLSIHNATTVSVFVRATPGASTAVVTDYEVAPGMKEVIDIGQNPVISVIPASSTSGNVYLGRGLGS